MDKRILVTLEELSRLLYGGNYEVAFRALSLAAIPGASPGDYLQAFFGDAGDARYQFRTTVEETITDIVACLHHRGDHGYGPSPKVLRSRRFKRAVGLLKTHLNTLSAEATSILSFKIASAYPNEWVWWEFAYLFITPTRAEVFIGASSD